MTSTAATSLEELERRAAFELECLAYPSRPWVAPRRHGDKPVYDALIVGGGQNGTTIAFHLLRERVTNIRVLDRSVEGRDGPWLNFARMHTLRTPKEVIGPELGIPSLSVRAWYQARFGEKAWEELGQIPRELWHEYIAWLRRMAGVDVTYDAAVTDIEPLRDGLLAVSATIGGNKETLLARNIVLATGIEGTGRWLVPDLIAESLPHERYAHTSEVIDFAALANRRVAVIGASASAFDNAATALENGALAVDLYCRRPKLPIVNPNRWIEFAGFLRHFSDLDDAKKWHFIKFIFDVNQPPPQDAFLRCVRHPNFTLHLDSPVERVWLEGGAIRLATPTTTQTTDFIICGTGFAIDFAARPELNHIAPLIALWSDRYRPPPGAEHPVIARFPYLSSTFQFTEKVPGTAPYLKNVFCYTYAAMASLACPVGISQLKFGAERIGYGITRELFLADADLHMTNLANYSEAALDTSAYKAARDGDVPQRLKLG